LRAIALLDTGAVLAILNRQDRWHRGCIEGFSQLRKPLLTSEAVLAELFHMVGDNSGRLEAAWKFVRSGAVTIGIIKDSDLPSISRLMHQYRDRPMDFADATLVHLAEQESLSTVLTIDFADFQTYRIGGTKRFRVLPNPNAPV
jgi:predicted nucleic acid-binding protein